MTPQISDQRIRDNIVELVEDFASFDRQRAYQDAVQIDAALELLAMWSDWVDDELLEGRRVNSALTLAELDAVRVIDDALDPAYAQIEHGTFLLHEVQAQTSWLALRAVAQRVLPVFEVRGRLSDACDDHPTS